MKKKAEKVWVDVQMLAGRMPGAIVLNPPESWWEGAEQALTQARERGTSRSGALYDWIKTELEQREGRRSTSSEIYRRIFIGRETVLRLYAVADVYVKKHRLITRDYFGFDVPNDFFAQERVYGQGVVVSPPGSEAEVQALSSLVWKEIYQTKINTEREQATGRNFGVWLKRSAKRPDLVGDLARDVTEDTDLDKDDLASFRGLFSALHNKGVSLDVLCAVCWAWEEYYEKYPDRAHGKLGGWGDDDVSDQCLTALFSMRRHRPVQHLAPVLHALQTAFADDGQGFLEEQGA